MGRLLSDTIDRKDLRIKGLEHLWSNEYTSTGLTHPAIEDRRAASIALIKEIGLPTDQCESYKYGNINQFYKETFTQPQPPEEGPHNRLSNSRVNPKPLVRAIDFTNGHVDEKTILQPITEAEKQGVLYISTLQKTIADAPGLIDTIINAMPDTPQDPFAALTAATANDGLFLKVKRDSVIDLPIRFCNWTNNVPYDTQYITATQGFIHLEPNASATLLTLNIGYDAWINSLFTIYLEENATLRILSTDNSSKLARLMTHFYVKQEKGSRYQHTIVSNAAQYVRNAIYPNLNQPDARCDIRGLILANGNNFAEIHTRITHADEHTSSDQLIKGIAQDKGRISFFGEIDVKEKAQKTLAYQKNANVLLSDSAKAYTRPQLIIHADDVKCSHGATTGQMDKDALFYMQQRGIDPTQCKRLLLKGFAEEILDLIQLEKLKEGVHEYIEQIVEELTKDDSKKHDLYD